MPTSASPSFAAGQKLGGVYLLRSELASGDRGVWLAYDEVLGKDVSLHLIPEAIRQDEKAMLALRQEVKRNRQLIHPNILRVYDLVEEKDWAAVSMDWFEGQSLARLLEGKEGKFFEPGDLKPWLQQLCQTLGDVHKIQIVHRNITPANLILEKNGKLLVMNFGIARVIEDALERLREKGKANRNLNYLSPQQLEGEVSTASDDVYAVGASIYELLTGEPPFTGKDLVQSVRKTAPMPMMERRGKLGKRGGTILPAWETAIGQCLAKQPSERPSGMYELAAKLGLNGKLAPEVAPVTPPPETAPPATAAVKPETKEPQSAETNKVASTGQASIRAVTPVPAAKAEEKAKPAPVPARAIAAAPIKKSVAVAEPSRPKDADTMRVEGGGASDIYPSLYPRRSKSPLAPIAAVLAVAAVGAGIFYFSRPDDESGMHGTSGAVENAQHVSGETGAAENFGGSENAGVEPLKQADGTQSPPSSQPAVDASSGAESASPAANVAENVESHPQADSQTVAPLAVAEAPQPVDAARTAAPEPEVALPAPPDLTPQHPAAAKDPDVAAKIAAARQARQTAEASDRAAKEIREKLRQAEAAAAAAQKSLDEKAKSVAPALKVVEDLAAQRKQREEQMKESEAAAALARQAAEEKARQAEDAKKALADFEAQNKEKLAARDKAESELQALRTDLAEKQRLAAEAAKTVASASETRQQQIAALRKIEDEAAQALAAAEKAASDESKKIAEQRNQQRQQIEKEIEDMKRLFEEKMKALEMLKSQVAEPGAKGTNQPSSPAKAPVQPKPTPIPSRPSADANDDNVRSSALTMQDDASNAPALTVPSAVPPVNPVEGAASVSQPQPGGHENSLGMRFAPVGDLLFCIWPTRIKDFEVFAKETKLKSTAWRAPGFKQASDHPVVNVTWNDAIGFCKWLTEREHKSGKLAAGQSYRLPTDLEWSKAVGLPEEVGKTPEDRDMGVLDVYPWGTQWPPPPNVGNYTGEETGSDVAIKGYDDGFAWTSPVGSFPPNRYGLYDMGGNVWQWCMDTWNGESKARVLRGASWYNGAVKMSLLASTRVYANPDSATDNFGFRIVRASDSVRSNKR